MFLTVSPANTSLSNCLYFLYIEGASTLSWNPRFQLLGTLELAFSNFKKCFFFIQKQSTMHLTRDVKISEQNVLKFIIFSNQKDNAYGTQ